MSVFSGAFWVKTLELVLVSFGSSFVGFLSAAGGSLTTKTIEAAAVSAGTAAFYALVTQLKSVQAVNAATKATAAQATAK